MKLNVKAFALAFGITWGVGLFILTWWIIAFEGETGEVTFIGRLYRGYNISPLGSLIGLGWGLVDGAIGGAIFAWLYNLIVGRSAKKTELDKKTIIAIAAVLISIIVGCFTLWQVCLYRSDLSLKYSPSIYPLITSLRDSNDPQLLIFNFGEPTTIIDYEITFKAADPTTNLITISDKELGEDFKIKGRKLPKKTTIFYFYDTENKHLLHNKLQDNTIQYCEGYVKVKNEISAKTEEFKIKCKRSYDDALKAMYWHPDPGPYY